MLLILPLLSLLSLLSLCLSISSFRWSFLFRSLPFYCFSSVSFSIDLFCLSVSSVSSFFLVGLSCPFRLYSLFSLLFLSLGLFCFSFSVSSRSLSFCSLLSLAVSCCLCCLFCLFAWTDSVNAGTDSVNAGGDSNRLGLIPSSGGRFRTYPLTAAPLGCRG